MMDGASALSDHSLAMDAELDVWLNQLTAIQQEPTSTPSKSSTILHPEPLETISLIEQEHSSLANLDSILGDLCELESTLNCQQSEINTSLNAIHSKPSLSPDKSHLEDLYSEDSLGELDSQLQSALSQLGDFTDYSSSRLSVSTARTSRSSFDSVDASFSYVNKDASFVSDSDSVSTISHDGTQSKPVELKNVLHSSQSCDSLDFDRCETQSESSETDVHDRLEKFQLELEKGGLTLAEQQVKMKEEKVRLALEKLKDANIKKLFVRAHTTDGSSKSILVDEEMTVAEIVEMLISKNHATPSVKWSIVEQLPDLHMERNFEDHDCLVENLVFWLRESENKIVFSERTDKYDVFCTPEKYLVDPPESDMSLVQRETLIEEFFSPKSPRIPELDGMLYLKSDGKKVWKRLYFVLRASGLYYNPKGKVKSSKDLVCLQKFDLVEVYTSINWRKFFKAPTEFGFALKHPQIQKKGSKHIKYLCAEDMTSFLQWLTGIRMAKTGDQLHKNYKAAKSMVDNWSVQHSSVDQLTDTPNSGSVQNSRKSSFSTPEMSPHRQVAQVQPSVQMREKNSVERDDTHRQSPKKMIPVLPLTTSTTVQITNQHTGSLRRVSQETIKRPSLPPSGNSMLENRHLPPPPVDAPLSPEAKQAALPPPPPPAVLAKISSQAQALENHYASLSAKSRLSRGSPQRTSGQRPVAPILPTQSVRPSKQPPQYVPYNHYFIEDLHRVHEQKHDLYGSLQSPAAPLPRPLPEHCISAQAEDYLPPPPAELLEGLRRPRKKNPPPPPPKRNRNTHLSQS